MIKDMAQVHMTEADVINNFASVLEKLKQGGEVIVEQDHRPVAVIRAAPVTGRNISEVIAAMEASGANAVIDEDFGRDVEEAIQAYRQPWTPTSWE